jgi:hypothetical protein
LTFAQTFLWRRTVDGDSPTPVQFKLHIWQPIPSGPEWTLSAGTDPTLTPSLALQANTVYAWEVFGEDLAGHRRVSRETRSFLSPGVTGVESPTASSAGRLDLQVGPNPFAGEVRFAPVWASRGSDSANASGAGWSWAIYDPQGRRLAMARQPLALDHGDAWDGTDAAGRGVPAGVYYLEVASGSFTTRRVLVRMR